MHKSGHIAHSPMIHIGSANEWNYEGSCSTIHSYRMLRLHSTTWEFVRSRPAPNSSKNTAMRLRSTNNNLWGINITRIRFKNATMAMRVFMRYFTPIHEELWGPLQPIHEEWGVMRSLQPIPEEWGVMRSLQPIPEELWGPLQPIPTQLNRHIYPGELTTIKYKGHTTSKNSS